MENRAKWMHGFPFAWFFIINIYKDLSHVPPWLNQDFIDILLSIGVGDAQQCRKYLFLSAMCVHKRKRKKSKPLNASVLAWLYSCIYATSICIIAYVG